jgi:hypothetical protein
MAGVMSLITTILMVLSAIGYGCMTLQLVGVLNSFSSRERAVWGFAFGFGVLGWIGFWFALAGWLSPTLLLVLILFGLPGVWLMRSKNSIEQVPKLDGWGWAISTGIVIALTFDSLEGLSPPIDADSLAYHFALPKEFISSGRLVFQPRALDGAVPLLQQMTYMIALGIGGEEALTLWAMTSGWGASALVFVISRRYLPLNWALAATLLFLTTPAVIYGAGSGQVEVRNAIFTLTSVFMAGEALVRRDSRFVVASGIAVGFFAASKYPGLIIALAVGIALMPARGWFTRGLLFSAAFFIAAGQWYAWNWWNTGDPIFPMLFGLLPYHDGVVWSAQHHANFLENYGAGETVVPSNLFWLIFYPLIATLNPFPIFESLRTGFGPLILVMLPFALIGAWHVRHKISAHPLLIFVVVASVSYTLWFLFGPSQRVRHLLPLYPLLLLSVLVLTHRATQIHKKFLPPLVASIIAISAIQIGGHGIFSTKHIQHTLMNEDKNAFVKRHVAGYEVVKWANNNLTQTDRIFVARRELIYLFDIPIFYGHVNQENQVNFHERANNTKLFAKELLSVKATHLLFSGELDNNNSIGGLAYLVNRLRQSGCLISLYQDQSQFRISRTLPSAGSSEINLVLYQLNLDRCRL